MEELPSTMTMRFFMVGDRGFRFAVSGWAACLDEKRMRRFFESVQFPQRRDGEKDDNEPGRTPK